MNKTYRYLAAASLALASPVNAQPVDPPPAANPSATGVAPAPGLPPALMPNIVVTATGYPERVSQIASTVQVITQDRIAHSPAKSVSELLAENAVGFMSQWTAAQTSINI